MGQIINSIGKQCLDCGDHVPVYQNYYCEKCWQGHLNTKLEEDKFEQQEN